MEKDEGSTMPAMFPSLDYSLDQLQPLKTAKNSESVDHHNLDSNPMGNVLVDMFNFHLSASSGGGCSAANNSLDKLSFADVMQFADYGPKLALNQAMDDQNSEVGREFDPIYFLKFPVLAEKADQQLVLAAGTGLGDLHQHGDHHIVENNYMDRDRLMPSVCLRKGMMISPSSTHGYEEDLEPGNHLVDQVPTSEDVSLNLKHTNSTNTTEKLGHDNDNQEQQIVISLDAQKNIPGFSSSANCRSEPPQSKPKRKRSRATKNSEEVESQRMTHIAVERNRRKQMNEHLRVLRSLMPGSYVQRGDQASIIGGAIEFVRELEQLLQCLESQKRRRLMYAEASARPSPTTDAPACLGPIQSSFPVFPAVLQPDFKYFEGNLYEPLREDIADNKSPVADIEVKLVGCDAMIKILSQRRPGQLLKTIAALENLHFSILHTNVTTIEQTVLYSFNVKVGGDCRLSADDIASSVQQIFNMLHAANMGYINE